MGILIYIRNCSDLTAFAFYSGIRMRKERSNPDSVLLLYDFPGKFQFRDFGFVFVGRPYARCAYGALPSLLPAAIRAGRRIGAADSWPTRGVSSRTCCRHVLAR